MQRAEKTTEIIVVELGMFVKVCPTNHFFSSPLCYVLPSASLFLHDTLGFRIFNKDITQLGQLEGITHLRAVARLVQAESTMYAHLAFIWSVHRVSSCSWTKDLYFHLFSNTTEFHYHTYHWRLSLTSQSALFARICVSI